MTKREKTAIKFAALFIIVGIVTAFAAAEAAAFDYTKLVDIGFVNRTHYESGSFEKIYVEVDDCDIVFKFSEDGNCSVVCPENDKVEQFVFIRQDTLRVTRRAADGWYSGLGIGSRFTKPTITVNLPRDKYASVEVITKTGNITVPDELEFTSINLTSESGNISLSSASEKADITVESSAGNVSFTGIAASLDVETVRGTINVKGPQIKNLSLKTVSGDISVSKVSGTTVSAVSEGGSIEYKLVTAKSFIKADTMSGNIELLGCDASSLSFNTLSGDLSGTLLSDKQFRVESGGGTVSVPQSSGSETFDAKTRSGNIRISVTK